MKTENSAPEFPPYPSSKEECMSCGFPAKKWPHFFFFFKIKKKQQKEDLPGGPAVKNPPVNAGDTGMIPGPGRSHMPQSNRANALQLLKPLRFRAQV